MNPTGDSAAPATQILPSARQREPDLFCGKPSEDVEGWLCHFERVSLHNKWDDSVKLATVIFSLEGTARVWFENHESELPRWQTFREKIVNAFAVYGNRSQSALLRLSTRAQMAGETITAYIEDVLLLCRAANPAMTETAKLSHLMKGVADDTFRHFVTKEPSSVKEFADECRKLQEAQKARLTVGHYARLPNITPSAFVTGRDSCERDLRSVIREVVRKEVRLHFSSMNVDSLGVPQRPPGQDEIRAEVQSYLGQSSASGRDITAIAAASNASDAYPTAPLAAASYPCMDRRPSPVQ